MPVWGVQVSRLLCSPLQRAQTTAQLIAIYQELAGAPKPEIETVAELTNRDWGDWDGKHALEVRLCICPCQASCS